MFRRYLGKTAPDTAQVVPPYPIWLEENRRFHARVGQERESGEECEAALDLRTVLALNFHPHIEGGIAPHKGFLALLIRPRCPIVSQRGQGKSLAERYDYWTWPFIREHESEANRIIVDVIEYLCADATEV